MSHYLKIKNGTTNSIVLAFTLFAIFSHDRCMNIARFVVDMSYRHDITSFDLTTSSHQFGRMPASMLPDSCGASRFYARGPRQRRQTMLGRTLWAVGMLSVVASLLPGGATYIMAPTCHFAPCTLVNPLAAAVRHGCASMQLPARTVQELRPHSRTRHCAMRALSTPPAAEFSSSERSLRELNRMLDMNEAELDVREATGTEGDSVAQLRCEVFGQGKEMYRSQCQKMRTSPNYLLAGSCIHVYI